MFSCNKGETFSRKTLVSALVWCNDSPDKNRVAFAIDKFIGRDSGGEKVKCMHSVLLLLKHLLVLPDYKSIAKEPWNAYEKVKYSPKAYFVDDSVVNLLKKSEAVQSNLDLFSFVQNNVLKILFSDNPTTKHFITLLSSSIAQAIHEETVPATCAPSLDGIYSLLKHHILFPLRAIHAFPCSQVDTEQNTKALKIISEMSFALLEGNYETWSHDISKNHFVYLREDDYSKWNHCERISCEKVNTIEESGLGLFWVPKIGGPSHGFDISTNCYLPLVCNDSVHSIVVFCKGDEFPVGRAHLRILFCHPAPETTNDNTPLEEYNVPILYLENKQIDFEFESSTISRDQIASWIVSHSLEKASYLGWDLTVREEDWDHFQLYLRSESSNFHVKHKKISERYFIPASAGIFEASDSLGYHDWAHEKGDVSMLAERVRITKVMGKEVF